MKIALYVVGVLVLLVLIVVVIGYSLPQSHRASREVTVSAPPERVFALIATPADYPKWRSGVDSVEVLPAEEGKERFRELGSDGPLLMRIEERVPNTRFVTVIADSTLPFGGKWTYELTPSGTGTMLRITEDGEVYNPVFRFVSRFVMGHTATMDKYLADVGKAIDDRR
jgi:uncharacterized protein YndB with AHSA1/START domain